MCQTMDGKSVVTRQEEEDQRHNHEHDQIHNQRHIQEHNERHNRVRGRTLQEIAPKQYGFMPDNETRNAIFVLKIISERAIEK